MIHTNKLLKIGGSIGIIIPKTQLKHMKLKEGDFIEIMYRIPKEQGEKK